MLLQLIPRRRLRLRRHDQAHKVDRFEVRDARRWHDGDAEYEATVDRITIDRSATLDGEAAFAFDVCPSSAAIDGAGDFGYSWLMTRREAEFLAHRILELVR